MNNEQAKTFVRQEIKQGQYTIVRENKMLNAGMYFSTVMMLGAGSMLIAKQTPDLDLQTYIIMGVGVLGLSAGIVKLLEHSYGKDYIRNNCGMQILKEYNKKLKKGINPLEEIPYDIDLFHKKLEQDIDERMNAKVKKIKKSNNKSLY